VRVIRGLGSAIKAIIPQRSKILLRDSWVRMHIRHVFGPKSILLGPTEAAVTCVVKNGAFHLTAFLDHYNTLGFKHVFLLDNGSTDETVALAREYDNVTVFECRLPIGSYQPAMKRSLAKIAVSAGWCLDVDIDEFFDFPRSGEMSLDQFLHYLNEMGYSAVLCQMLDVFSERPIAALAENAREVRLDESYCYYDLSDVTMVNYEHAELTQQFGARNELSCTGVNLLFGGIRKTLFGLNPLLTKHSLFVTDSGLELFTNSHFLNGATLADVSCVLLHYKLVSNCYESSSMNSDAFPVTRKGYEDLIDLIETRPELRIVGPGSKRFTSATDLLEEGFLFASRSFSEAAAREQVV
jgi:hypothetical protein